MEVLCKDLMNEVLEAILGQEKCIKQFALIAVRNAKFHSNPPKANLFTVKNVIERKEDSNLKPYMNIG